MTGTEHEEVIISGGPGASLADPGNYVVPVDLTTGAAGTALPLGGLLEPLAVAIAPDGTKAYVANTFEDEVVPIDVATNTAETPIPVDRLPEAIAIAPDGTRAYTANFGDNTVTAIDIPSGSTADIPVGNGPGGIAITPDGTQAYVSNYWDETVTPIDLGTETAGAPIPVGELPWGIAITPDGTRAYVANNGDDTVTRIDIPANTASTPIAVAQSPTLLAIAPSGDRAFTIGGRRPITPIDLATDTAEAGVVTGEDLEGIAIYPDGSRAYITNRDMEGLIQLLQPANTLVPSFPVGERPEAIAIVPNQPPHAAFVASPAKPEPETSASFDAGATTDSDGTPTRYDWDFGDGETATDGGATPVHTYAVAGTYTVTLTVTDNEGCSTTLVFTGQTAHCNGSSVAQTTRVVEVAAAPTPEDPPAEPPATVKEEGTPEVFPTPTPAGDRPAEAGGVKGKRRSFRCPRVTAKASSFVPRLRPGHVVPGVRVRIDATRPLRLRARAVLLWSEKGQSHSVDLGKRFARINHWRRVRFSLPTHLRSALPYGKTVRVRLKLKALPYSPSSSCPGKVTWKTLRLEVVKVFPQAVQRGRVH